MNKPQIRIKGFDEEWKNSKLGDISSSFSGGTPPADNKEYYGSGIPFIRSGEINSKKTALSITEKGLNNSSAKMVRVGTLLYALYGATSGEVGISHINGAINQAILAIIPNENLDNYFLYCFLQAKKNKIVNSLLQGGQGNLSGALVKNISTIFPINLKEQIYISAFFRSLDSLINSTSKKLTSLKQIKAASLQAMFPQNGETKPKVRFKGFDGDWETCKLSNIARRVTRKNTNLESRFPLTISSIDGLVSQINYFNNIVASSNLRGYYLIKNGEFAYNKSYSNGYPWGSVKRLDRYENGALSTLYIVFEIKGNISSDYLTHFFDTSLWHKDVSERAAEGARNHGLLNISADDFLDIQIIYPNNISEQQKIASYFRSLDNQISLQEKRLEKLKQIKSACLDKMFV